MERNGYCPHIVIIVEPDDIISYVVFLYALFFAHLGLKSVHILTPHYENRNTLCFPHYMATASILSYSQSESGLVDYQDTAKRLVDTIGRYHQFSLPEYLADYQSFLQEYDNNYNKQLTQPILYEEMRNNPNHTIIAISIYDLKEKSSVKEGNPQLVLEGAETVKDVFLTKEETIVLVSNRDVMLPEKGEIFLTPLEQSDT